MSDERDGFVEKFRASLRARVYRLKEMLGVLRHVQQEADALAQVLGELHTLKGEARLLGLLPLSELAHVLETVLSGPTEGRLPAVERSLDTMARALSDKVPRQEADALLQEALERLQQETGVRGEEGSSSPEEPGTADPARGEHTEHAPAAASLPSGDAAPLAASAEASRWVQVDGELIDELCETMAAISGDYGRLFAQAKHLVEVMKRDSSLGTAVRSGASLIEEFARFRVALDNATVRTWQLRMVPAYPLLRELAEHARQLASAADKPVEVSVDASGVQLERDALDKVWDAMLHLVRNSIDHGLESAEERGDKDDVGSLTIGARTVGTSITLTVADDGRGIDCERVRRAAVARRLLTPQEAEAMSDDDLVQLVFEQGFSTRESVSSLSGRGVGLDVVKMRAEELGGRVEVHTQKGAGARFSITLPFTLTKERLLVFELTGALYGLPARAVLAVVGQRDLPKGHGDAAKVFRFNEQPAPLLSLSELLGREPEPTSAALVVELQDQVYGLLIPKVLGERELLRRPAEPLLARTTAIGASALMEDGRAVLVLDLAHIARSVRRAPSTSEGVSPQSLATRSLPTVLLVDDSPVIRDMVSEILASAGLRVVTAPNGVEALAALSRAEPDLVISDIEMPQMDGFTLLEQIRKRSQRLPVVMLTTRASVEDRQRATTSGANAYVLKADFRSDVLLDVVQRFVPLHR